MDSDLLRELLPAGDCSLLSGIDFYGDTVFNRIQMNDLLPELTKLKANKLTSAQIAHVSAIEQLALKCKQEVHLYLKFIGD